MSKKTFFKRAALTLVASLGLGFVSVPSSQAAIVSSSLTLSAATASVTVGDTATGTWTTKWSVDTYTTFTSAGGAGDSVTVRYTCDAPVGASCPAIQGRQTPSSDTANIYINEGRTLVNAALASNPSPWINIAPSALNGWADSATLGAGVSARSVVSYKAAQFSKAGTYTYTFYLVGVTGAAIAGTSTTWTVTATAPSTTAASIRTSYLAPTEAQANYWRYGPSGARAIDDTSRDSSVVAAAGTASSSTLAAVLYVVPANSAGDTRVAVGSGFLPVQDTLTATITGA